MKAFFVIVSLLIGAGVFAQARVGAEVGASMDLYKRPSLLTRVNYSAPIRKMRVEGGVLVLFGRDGGFGFDVLITRPIGRFEPFTGTRFLVWEQSMSVGIPLGLRWNALEGDAELTLGLSVAPTLHLTAEERNTVIFDTYIGVRF